MAWRGLRSGHLCGAAPCRTFRGSCPPCQERPPRRSHRNGGRGSRVHRPQAAGGMPVWSGGGRSQQLALHADSVEAGSGDRRSAVRGSQRDCRCKEQTLCAHWHPIFLVRSWREDGLQSSIRCECGTPSHREAVSAVVWAQLRRRLPVRLFDPEHYSVNLSGEAELARLLNVGKALGVGTPGVGLAGPAQMDLEVAGTWVGFAPPVPSGKIQLRNVTAELQGVSEPLQIASATATLADQAVNVTSFTAAFAQGPEISGSASFPVHCTAPETCIVHFDAHTDDVSLSRLNRSGESELFALSRGTACWLPGSAAKTLC